MMNCNISGEVPNVPCISTKSGLIFEKSLIEKYIKQYGKCPVTNDELTMNDIILINNNNNIVKPKPPAAASVPGALALLQNEWDAMMLEMFTLKQNLHRTRQELSRALYQHDAACRVIARLIKERDEARQHIGTIEQNDNNYNVDNNNNNVKNKKIKNNDNKMQVDDDDESNNMNNGKIDENVSKQLRENAKVLQSGRRPLIKNLQSKILDINEFNNKLSNHIPFDKDHGTCIETRDQLVVVGTKKGSLALWYKNNKRKTSFLRSYDHKDEITSIQIHPTKNIIYTSSNDKTIRIFTFSFDDNNLNSTLLNEFDHPIVGCTLHPYGKYLSIITNNGVWYMYNTENNNEIFKHTTDYNFTCIKFHPDGLILGIGDTDGHVHMFDVTQQKKVFTFEGHKTNVNTIDFSNNGYYFASGDNNGIIKLWDLRKLEEKETYKVENNTPIYSLAFDPSGTYLLISSDNIRTIRVKKWEVISSIDDFKDVVSSVSFSSSLSFFAVLFNNAHVRLYSTNK